MTDAAEEVKAREYLRQKGTLLAAPRIRERVAAAFAAMERVLEQVTESEARARPLPGEWSVQEVVDHLVETNGPSLRELRELLADRRPGHGPIPAGLQSADPMARAYPDLVRDLRAGHAEILDVLGSAPDRLTDARAPIVMVINAKGPDGAMVAKHWIEELDWKAYAIVFRLHELDHLKQAEKILATCRASAR